MKHKLLLFMVVVSALNSQVQMTMTLPTSTKAQREKLKKDLVEEIVLLQERFFKNDCNLDNYLRDLFPCLYQPGLEDEEKKDKAILEKRARQIFEEKALVAFKEKATKDAWFYIKKIDAAGEGIEDYMYFFGKLMYISIFIAKMDLAFSHPKNFILSNLDEWAKEEGSKYYKKSDIDLDFCSSRSNYDCCSTIESY